MNAMAQEFQGAPAGIGAIGEVREGSNGQLYQWVEGVDGLGNPIGFWKSIRRLARKARPFLRRALPLAKRFAPFIPGVGPAVSAGITVASPFMKQAGLTGLGEMYETDAPPAVEGVLGEVQPGMDGHLYQWTEGVDGLGNPIGFWNKLRKLGKRFRPFLRRALPLAQRFAPMVPGFGPSISAGITAASPFLKQAGLTGLGELYATPDGSVYEVAGWVGDDDPTTAGIGDDELVGLEQDEGAIQADLMDAEEMNGFGQCHVEPGGVNGLGAYVPSSGGTPTCPTRPEQATMFRPLW